MKASPTPPTPESVPQPHGSAPEPYMPPRRDPSTGTFNVEPDLPLAGPQQENKYGPAPPLPVEAQYQPSREARKLENKALLRSVAVITLTATTAISAIGVAAKARVGTAEPPRNNVPAIERPLDTERGRQFEFKDGMRSQEQGPVKTIIASTGGQLLTSLHNISMSAVESDAVELTQVVTPEGRLTYAAHDTTEGESTTIKASAQLEDGMLNTANLTSYSIITRPANMPDGKPTHELIVRRTPDGYIVEHDGVEKPVADLSLEQAKDIHQEAAKTAGQIIPFKQRF